MTKTDIFKLLDLITQNNMPSNVVFYRLIWPHQRHHNSQLFPDIHVHLSFNKKATCHNNDRHTSSRKHRHIDMFGRHPNILDGQKLET